MLIDLFNFSIDKINIRFPYYKIHDEEYCNLFLKIFSRYIKNFKIKEAKLDYLLTSRVKDDKSKFLNSLGYNLNNKNILLNDIIENTDLKSLTYHQISEYGFICEGKTILKGKIVITGRELEKDLTLRLITLIPGGDKK